MRSRERLATPGSAEERPPHLPPDRMGFARARRVVAFAPPARAPRAPHRLKPRSSATARSRACCRWKRAARATSSLSRSNHRAASRSREVATSSRRKRAIGALTRSNSARGDQRCRARAMRNGSIQPAFTPNDIRYNVSPPFATNSQTTIRRRLQRRRLPRAQG